MSDHDVGERIPTPSNATEPRGVHEAPVADASRSSPRRWRLPAADARGRSSRARWLVVGPALAMVGVLLLSAGLPALAGRPRSTVAAALLALPSQVKSDVASLEHLLPGSATAPATVPGLDLQTAYSSGYEPNQIDLGMTVVNLSISDINFFDNGGDLYKRLDLTVSFQAIDPITGATVSQSPPDSSAQGVGCGNVMSCGMYEFAYSSVGLASVSIMLQDDQRPYLGCLCGVNIDGSSDTITIPLQGTLYGPQQFFLTGAPCTATSPCTYTTSGSSGSREASVTFTMTVETATLSQTAGQQSTLSAFQAYINGLDNNNAAVVCPSSWSSIANLVSPEAIEAIMTGVFAIMTLGLGTGELLSIQDVMQEYVLEADRTIYDGVAGSWIYPWGQQTGSYYPSDIAAIPGLLSAADSIGIWACVNLELWYESAIDTSGSAAQQFSYDDSGDLATALGSLGSLATTLETSGIAAAVTALGSAYSALNRAANDIPNIDSAIQLYQPGNPAAGCTFGVYPSGGAVPCYYYGDYLEDEVFQPVLGVLQDTMSMISQTESALSALESAFGLNVCGGTIYAAEGQSLTVSADQQPVNVTGGIGPSYATLTGGPSWLSLQSVAQPGPDLSGDYALVGAVPWTTGSSALSFSVSDDVGDKTTCSATIEVVAPTMFVETGLPAGTSWSVTANGVTQSSSSNAIVFAEPAGTVGYTVAAVNGITPTPASGSLTVGGSLIAQPVSFLTVALLNTYAETPETTGGTYTLSFTVPVGASHVLFFWSIADTTTTPSLTFTNTGNGPGPTTEELISTSTGVAYGALTAGGWTATLSVGSAGYVNTVTMAAYAVYDDVGYAYDFGAAAQAKALTLPSGGAAYVGVEMTGGAYGISSPSLTTIDAQTAATNPGTGNTGLIGRQASPAFSMTTSAGTYGIVAVGLVAPLPLVFEESGLPSGTSWSATVGGATESSSTGTLLFEEPAGSVSYSVSKTYEYQPAPSTGSVTVSGPVTVVPVTFSAIAFGVSVLNTYEAHPDGYGATYTLSFTVPAGVAHEIFLWSISDNGAITPTYPSGLSIETQFGTSTGIAYGQLAPATYSVTLPATSTQWVNTVTMAVLGVSGDLGYTTSFNSAAQATSLAFSSGATDYIGVDDTGGSYGVTSTSFATIFTEAAPNNAGTGYAGIIGLQAAATLTLVTAAASYGIAGVALYP